MSLRTSEDGMDGTYRRSDGRMTDGLRPVSIIGKQSIHAEGSALIAMGNTRVLCLATVEQRVPPFLDGADQGWVTAEYAMLPRATHTRGKRDRHGASGRTLEIQRLIGRSLRAVVDLTLVPGYTVTVDCDVLQADGGTRCASITGAWVALVDAFRWMVGEGLVDQVPILSQVAAVSVGVVQGTPLLDLCYEEDSTADVDMNIVMTGSGRFVEIQGTAEHEPFDESALTRLISLARAGLSEIFAEQRAVLGLRPDEPLRFSREGDQS